ncbi:MAG: transposase, partial [Polyangiaceae bacterium]|nr:transposase [Polyangiaceae bacterium]
FTPEFKAEAVELMRSSDKPIAQLAEDLGISEQSLYRWAKQADIDKKDVPSGQLMTKEREELAKVRKELKQLKQLTMERDFLKKRLCIQRVVATS